MARIRSVKPGLRTSRVVASWPFEVRYFWVLLWGYLDDEGRGLDLPRAIAADCYPLDKTVTERKVDRWLDLIASTRINPGDEPPLCRYEIGGREFLHAVNWREHQHPNRPTPSTHPPCPLHERLTESRSESRSEPPLSRHMQEEEREEEIGGGGGLTEPPPLWCDRHPGGTDRPCRGCQTARETRETWLRTRRLVTAAAALYDAATIADAKTGPPCDHGMPGGLTLHPSTHLPLCPLCRAWKPNEESVA